MIDCYVFVSLLIMMTVAAILLIVSSSVDLLVGVVAGWIIGLWD